MPATYVNIASANGVAVSTLAVNVPSGVANGNLMILQVGVQSLSGRTIDAISGWTLESDLASGATVRQAVFYRIANSEPSTYTASITGGTARVTAAIIAFSNVDTASPIVIDSVLANASSTSLTATGITPGVANTTLVGLYTQVVSSGTPAITPPTGMTERADYGTSSLLRSEITTEDYAASTATGNRVATSTIAGISVGALVALRPAATAFSATASVTPAVASTSAAGTFVALPSYNGVGAATPGIASTTAVGTFTPGSTGLAVVTPQSGTSVATGTFTPTINRVGSAVVTPQAASTTIAGTFAGLAPVSPPLPLLQEVFQIAAYDGASGNLIADWSANASGLSFARNRHGASTMRVTVAMSEMGAYSLYDGMKMWRIEVSVGPLVVWAGRLEDVRITDDGVDVGAYGSWRALSDNEYTALWSDTRVSDWRVLTSADRGDAYQERYTTDTSNRLYMAPQKNAVFGTNPAYACWFGYEIPNQSARQITAITFDYAVPVGVTWLYELRTHAGPWNTDTTQWSVSGSGVVTQSGTITRTFTGVNQLSFLMYYNGAPVQFMSETGDVYLRITNIRIKTTASTFVYADEIARAIVAYVNTTNPTQLSSSTALIQSPVVDLTNITYEDMMPSTILDDLADYGDNQSTPRVWHAGVTDNQELYFQPFGDNAKTWYIDLSETLDVEQTLDNLVNRTRSLYEDANGNTIRTVNANDTTSQSRYGVIRDRSLSADTTSLTVANKQRDLALIDGATPKPRTNIETDRVYDERGNAWPVTVLAIGDAVVIRNFSLVFVQDVDRITSFRLAEIEIDETGMAQLTPDESVPQLASYLAKQNR